MIRVLEEVDSKVIIETLFGMRDRITKSANECDVDVEEIDNMLNILTSDALEDIFNGMSLSFTNAFRRTTRHSIVPVGEVKLGTDFFLFSVKGKKIAVQLSDGFSNELISDYYYEKEEGYIDGCLHIIVRLLENMLKEYFITFNNGHEIKKFSDIRYERMLSFMVDNDEKNIINIYI